MEFWKPQVVPSIFGFHQGKKIIFRILLYKLGKYCNLFFLPSQKISEILLSILQLWKFLLVLVGYGNVPKQVCFLWYKINVPISEFSKDEQIKEQTNPVIISWLYSDTTLLAQWTHNLKLHTLFLWIQPAYSF